MDKRTSLFFCSVFCIACIAALFSGCQTINRSKAQAPVPDKTVIWTFDDGPNGDTTARLLDVLKKHNIQALFVLLGENAEQQPELVRRMRGEGHSLVNHGYLGGSWAVRMGREEFRANLDKGAAAIAAASGEEFRPKLYRPHGGFYKKQQEKAWQEEGYALVPVTARVYDAVLSAGKREEAVKKVIRRIERQNGGIILLHDARDSRAQMEAHLAKDPDGVFNRSWIPGAVEEIIIALQEKGYIQSGFDPLPLLLPAAE